MVNLWDFIYLVFWLVKFNIKPHNTPDSSCFCFVTYALWSRVVACIGLMHALCPQYKAYFLCGQCGWYLTVFVFGWSTISCHCQCGILVRGRGACVTSVLALWGHLMSNWYLCVKMFVNLDPFQVVSRSENDSISKSWPSQNVSIFTWFF
jgi:hypothetical protein